MGGTLCAGRYETFGEGGWPGGEGGTTSVAGDGTLCGCEELAGHGYAVGCDGFREQQRWKG